MNPKGKIIVLTGAGVSADSGIATFRANDGLWENHRVEDVATPEAFQRDPSTVHRFYNARRRGLLDPKIQPNEGHLALAKLEAEWEGEFHLITQNIDDLHERAGSRLLTHMHGELLKVRCAFSGEVFEWKDDLTLDHVCKCCRKHARLRPHVVWFGEIPLQMDRLAGVLRGCDLFLSIGTSGNVYPAAGFAREAKAHSECRAIEMNLEKSAVNRDFDQHIQGRAADIVPTFVEELLRNPETF